MKDKDQILLEEQYNIVLKSNIILEDYSRLRDEFIKLFTNHNGGSKAIEHIIMIVNDPTKYNKTPDKIMNTNGEEVYAVKMFDNERHQRHLNRMSGPDEAGMWPSILNSLGIVKNPNEKILTYDPSFRYPIFDKDRNKIGKGYITHKTLGGVAETPENKDEVLDFLNDILGEVLGFENEEKRKREEREAKYKKEDDYISKTNPFIGGKYGSDRGWTTD